MSAEESPLSSTPKERGLVIDIDYDLDVATLRISGPATTMVRLRDELSSFLSDSDLRVTLDVTHLIDLEASEPERVTFEKDIIAADGTLSYGIEPRQQRWSDRLWQSGCLLIVAIAAILMCIGAAAIFREVTDWLGR